MEEWRTAPALMMAAQQQPAWRAGSAAARMEWSCEQIRVAGFAGSFRLLGRSVASRQRFPGCRARRAGSNAKLRSTDKKTQRDRRRPEPGSGEERTAASRKARACSNAAPKPQANPATSLKVRATNKKHLIWTRFRRGYQDHGRGRLICPEDSGRSRRNISKECTDLDTNPTRTN